MNTADFQTYIYEHIPITRAMDIRVVEFSTENVVLRASLSPNINHRDSAFGGSISSLLIMTGWAKVYRLLEDHGLKGTIVIQNSRLEYLAPVTTDFSAEADALGDEEAERFLKTLRKFGKARLKVHAALREGDQELAGFEGSFVVVVKETVPEAGQTS